MKKKTWIALCLVVALAMANVIGAGAADIAADGTKETEQMTEDVISDDVDEVTDGETEADEQSEDGTGSTGEAVDSGENAGTGQDGEDEAAGLGLMGINGLPQEDEDGGIPMAIDNEGDQDGPTIGFSVAVTPQGKVEAGKEATFDVKIRNVTEKTLRLTNIWYDCYNYEVDYGEDADLTFGTLSYKGSSVEDIYEKNISAEAGTSETFTLTGTIPAEWSEKEGEWHVNVGVSGIDDSEEEYIGYGAYPLSYWDLGLSLDVSVEKTVLDVGEKTAMTITVRNDGVDDVDLEGYKLTMFGYEEIVADDAERGEYEDLLHTFGKETLAPKGTKSVTVNIRISKDYLVYAGDELWSCINLVSPDGDNIAQVEETFTVSDESAPVRLNVTIKPGFDVKKAVKGETYSFEVTVENPSSKDFEEVYLGADIEGIEITGEGTEDENWIYDTLAKAKLSPEVISLKAGSTVTVKGTITMPQTIDKKYNEVVLAAYANADATESDSAYAQEVEIAAGGYDELEIVLVDSAGGSGNPGAQTGSAAASNAGGVQTGDMAPITTLMVLMVVSAMAASVAWRKRSVR